MTSQEELSVEAAAERLGVTPEAVRNRIKRGTLPVTRRDGREQVMLMDTSTQAMGNGDRPTQETARAASNGTIVRLRAEIWRHKRRVMAVERERDRLVRQFERQQKLMDLECALCARLQDQIDCLCDRLATALPEVVGDPTEGADRLATALPEVVGDPTEGADRLATALPEVVGDPTEGADLMWKRGVRWAMIRLAILAAVAVILATPQTAAGSAATSPVKPHFLPCSAGSWSVTYSDPSPLGRERRTLMPPPALIWKIPAQTCLATMRLR